jgi:ADP-ribose pyrophosphatase YjhB (NUDIX family)
MEPTVRVTGVLIEGDKILLVEQDVTESRHWSLPGGVLEFGETIEHCLIREMKEETGLDVLIVDLLYVCDRIRDGRHIVHITLSANMKSGSLGTGHGSEFATGKIKSVKWVPFSELESHGFLKTFCDLVKSGFLDRGAYKGDISNIGL